MCAVSSAVVASSAFATSPQLSSGTVQNSAQSEVVHANDPVASLRDELAELRRKVEKPPKDVWDKVSAISGLISGLTVALIGFYATNVYNRRQRELEEHRRDQELLVSQVQTVEKFIPHLSSDNEKTKAGALIAIAQLGNEELAVKLAAAFGGSGGTAALKSITSTSGGQVRASAAEALGKIGPDAVDATPALVAALYDPGENVRASAAEALGKIGPAAAAAAPALLAALYDRDKNVRASAAEALGKIGPAAAPTAPDLVTALHDPDKNVRASAAEALDKIRRSARSSN